MRSMMVMMRMMGLSDGGWRGWMGRRRIGKVWREGGFFLKGHTVGAHGATVKGWAYNAIDGGGEVRAQGRVAMEVVMALSLD